MATVNFSVPDEVKEAFAQTFGDRNKSAIVAELMRRAVREEELRRRREKLFGKLTGARSRRPSITAEDLRKTRSAGRP